MESGAVGAERCPLVVICDDTPQIRRLIRINLELDGYEVEEAADGEAAIDLLERLDGLGRRPDLVLLDAAMEPRNGWWLLSTLRADPRWASVPVVMVTASVQAHDRVQAEDAGASAFLAKPFDPDDLLALVSQFAGRGGPTPAHP
ncbi:MULTISPECIES: response regulator [unclassified Janibacter]|uniref:response regulator n=1 Tax=unclassified Janibacter TaxID=2649294 RepID=UPI003CFF6118